MTIKQKIEKELKSLQETDKELYDVCYRLYNSVKNIITEVSDHLSKIQTQMPDYDKHSKEHSEKVINNIELLLQDKGMDELTLLEAMLIELCGYFHDTGMAMPDWSFVLLKEVESENYTFHNDSPIRTIKSELQTRTDALYDNFERIKDLFFCPDNENALLSYLAQEIWEYEQYRMGLLDSKSNTDNKYIESTRQEYLRSTHSQRAMTYAKHIKKKLISLDVYDATIISESVGKICNGHCQDIKAIGALNTRIQILRGKTNSSNFTYNERFIAMLLRLGDVIHFSEDRTSRTLYAEHTPMNHISDDHWQVKIDNLHYLIEQIAEKTTISYFAGFQKPHLYYFLHDYLDWVDDELQNYAAFVQDMEHIDHSNATRYRIGLPTKVKRDGIHALGFYPDSNLKFRLEQKKVIQLLMGLRLYSDEFLCLRELYQNSLDSCRCMKAHNHKKGLNGDLTIEFGLSTDDGGQYIYCRDEGTGMTKHIVMTYLLRVGNSYYNSPDFKRENVSFENNIDPVSEFGIGILSCYMIGKRIEIITKHFSNQYEPCWVCMEGTEDYGFFREVTKDVVEQIGNHGTIVKIYLKDDFKSKIHSDVPENIDEIIYMASVYNKCKTRDVDIDYYLYEGQLSLTVETDCAINQYKSSLYQKIQKVIFEPEDGINVYITDTKGHQIPLVKSNQPFVFPEKFEKLLSCGFKRSEIFTLSRESHINKDFPDNTSMQEWLSCFSWYYCKAVDETTKSEAYTILHLPSLSMKVLKKSTSNYILSELDHFLSGSSKTILVDGMCILGMEQKSFYDDEFNIRQPGIRYNFKGKHRPTLTVDRENIREVSDNVRCVKTNIWKQMIHEIVNTITEHMSKFEATQDYDTMQYIDRYLFAKFDLETYCEVMRILSQNAFLEYTISNFALHNVFSEDTISIPQYNFANNPFSFNRLVTIAASKSDSVLINGNSITIKKSDQKHIIDYTEFEQRSHMFIRVDNWIGEYSQYDIVNKFFPFVPEKMFDLLDSKPAFSNRVKIYSNPRSNMNLIDVAFTDPFFKHDFLFSISRSDALLQLDDNQDILHAKTIEGIKDEEHKKYVIFVHICPRALSEDEERELQRYENRAEFVRGIREGWSILFYRYLDGYLIVPGIVDRNEIIKKIPSEAKNHNDGITYYFTDGVKAF